MERFMVVAGVKIRFPTDVIPLLKRWRNSRQENFIVLTLDNSHAVIKAHHISKGLVNRTIVHPRECYYHAIKDNAVAVIFAHNHPSGDPQPSDNDIELTKRLCSAGNILGFHVVDHVIISKYESVWYSFRKEGLITDDYEFS
jgi:DNA repair protein RadC